MATYVLVHGAWQGASTWTFVEEGLRARGHKVHTPTMSGAGIRRYELRPEINLETHVKDVLGVLEFEDLRDVILVGHSYGGIDRKSTRLNSSHIQKSRMPSSA